MIITTSTNSNNNHPLPQHYHHHSMTIATTTPSVKLISITPDAEKTIAYCARVSNPNNQENHETMDRLLGYCIKHGHWSVFEMANIVLEINTTRAISPQILRHRSFTFQEFSQRYASTLEGLGGLYPPHLRKQDLKNRQNSTDDLSSKDTTLFYRRIAQHFAEAEDLYSEMVSKGVAKECAREVLPLAAPTRLYMNGTIRSWIHYIELRSGNGTQLEHRQIAQQAKEIFSQNLPIISKALEWT
jgi:thymidylate synthase (FAD)